MGNAKLNVGVVGAAGRGASFRAAFDALPVTRVHAVCDVREDLLAQAAARLGASAKLTTSCVSAADGGMLTISPHSPFSPSSRP